MRVAVLSDVHANLEALEAVLRDARDHQCTHYVCLGDVVGYNANPRECLNIVREQAWPSVKGNHDEQASLAQPAADFNEWAQQAILWTRQQLSETDRAWLHDLPIQLQVDDFTIVHATLNAPGEWGYVFTPSDATVSFKHQQTAICFFGHTHVQGAFLCDGSAKEISTHMIRIESGKKYFVNAGSVGQPRDGDWRAAYCIFRSDENLIEQRRVPYDVEQARKKVIRAGLPRLLAERLAIGR
jgi:predicted phosphodiesterase